MNKKNETFITYGCGSDYKPDLFEPIINIPCFNKPKGGLWGSPIESEYGWREAAKEMDLGDFSSSFKYQVRGELMIIDTLHDLMTLPFMNIDSSMNMKFVNFEAIIKNGVEAILLTNNGQAATRLTYPENLYGWDCESILILNKDCVHAL